MKKLLLPLLIGLTTLSACKEKLTEEQRQIINGMCKIEMDLQNNDYGIYDGLYQKFNDHKECLSGIEARVRKDIEINPHNTFEGALLTFKRSLEEYAAKAKYHNSQRKQ